MIVKQSKLVPYWRLEKTLKRQEREGRDIISSLPFRPVIVSNTYFDELFRTETYQLWLGGGGSAKSYEKARSFLWRAMTEKYFRLLFCRKTAIEVRDSCFLLFKDIIRDHGWQSQFKVLEGSMDIYCVKTGNVLLSGGLDDVDKLKSIAEITDVWLEEPLTRAARSNITFDDFIQLDLRLRTKKVPFPRMHMTFNPVTKNSWIYEYFFEQELYTPVRKLKTTFRDNNFSSAKMIASLERLAGVRNDDYLVYHDGEWANQKSGKEWIYQFSTAIHTGWVPFVRGLDVGLTFDFNIEPYQTMLCAQVINVNGILQVRIFKEYCLSTPHNSPEACCQAFIVNYPEQFGFVPVKIYGDASGKWSVNVYNGIFAELLAYTGSDKDQVLSVNPLVSTARDLINDILAEKYDIRLLIDRTNCPNLIKDMESLQQSPDGFDPEVTKIDGHRVETKGHCYSALVYLIARLFPELLKENAIY